MTSKRGSWFFHVFSMELRQFLAYRFEFWFNFFGQTATQIGVAYFLWSAVFAQAGTEKMQGYTFPVLMFYYLLVPSMERLVRGHENYSISSEIYSGTLTRYLLYPLSFLGYLFSVTSSRQVMSLVQAAVVIAVFLLLFGAPADLNSTLTSILMGLALAWVASVVYFCLGSSFELCAFWVENVWTLMVILRFTVLFLGGGMIPLEFFPEWAQRVLSYSPFPYLLAAPVRLILGEAGAETFLRGLIVLGVWGALFFVLMRLIWSRGTRQYAGVGI